MWRLLLALALAFAAATASAAGGGGGLYENVAEIRALTSQNFAKEVFATGHVWAVEFYSPQCGHCRAFAPEFIRAAKAELGFVRFGAVNCVEHSDVCGAFGVSGVPSVKLFPSERRQTERGIVKDARDYNGPRTAAALAAAAEALLPEPPFVLKSDADADEWLRAAAADEEKRPSVLLFSDKPRSSTLFKALCVDFRVGLRMAEVRAQHAPQTVARFGVEKFPALIVVVDDGDGGDEKAVRYSGPTTYVELYKFLFAHAKEPLSAQERQREMERKKAAADPHEWDLQRIASAADWERACVAKQGVCALAVLDPANMAEAEVDAYVGLLRELAALYRGKLHVMWLGALEQPALVESLDLRSGFPALVAINPSRLASSTSHGRYTRFVGAFAVDSISNFFDALLAGRKGAVELKSPLYFADVNPEDFLPPKEAMLDDDEVEL